MGWKVLVYIHPYEDKFYCLFYYAFTHKESFSYQLFPNPPIKLKLGLQVGGRLLIATHLNQSNYDCNQLEDY
jgi:hypothetical protein